MPNGDTQDVKESTYAHKAVIERLRAKRDMIATLPIEKQLDVYGVAFDRFARPTYAKLGLKDKDLEQAKDRWIVGVVSPQGQKPLTNEFGVDKPKIGYATEGSAELVGMGAGALGGIKNILDFFKMPGGIYGDKESPVRHLVAKGEEKGYKLAHDVSPGGAEFGAGVGHVVPAVAAFEAGAAAIPSAAKNAPLAYRLLSYLGKTAAGTATMSTTEEKPTAEKVLTQTGINIAFDALLRGFGKAGAKGASRIINGLKTKGTPAQKVAASAVDDLLTTILKEKHPGKTIDSLKPEEFDAAVKEVAQRRATIENQAKEASKAVKEAKKAVKPTKEQQVLDKARLAEAKKAETKASNEKARAFHKRLVDYKKVTGSLPPEGHPHLEALKSGKTVSEILPPPPTVAAVQSAIGVADASKEAAIKEGAPQAISAVEAIKSVSPERRVATGTSPTGTERRSIAQILSPVDETIRLKEYYKTVINDSKSTEAEKAYAADAYAKLDPSSVGGGGKELAEKIRSATKGEKKQEMFKVDIDQILKAESPQEFAKAKKEAMDDVVKQAREVAKGGRVNQQTLVHEANKARERIRSIEVPKTFSKKTLDATRKAKEAEGTAGSVPVEEVASGKSTVTSSSDPEVEMLRNEQLLDQLKEVSSEKSFAYVSEVIKKRGGDLKLQNDMIEAAIDALKRTKKPAAD
jgi:hypothetical protein